MEESYQDAIQKLKKYNIYDGKSDEQKYLNWEKCLSNFFSTYECRGKESLFIVDQLLQPYARNQWYDYVARTRQNDEPLVHNWAELRSHMRSLFALIYNEMELRKIA